MDCLELQAKELDNCPKCQEEGIAPIKVYCGVCGVKYQLLDKIEMDKTYIC